MCLACEQDGIWLAYLESRGLLNPDDPAAVDAFFSSFPVQTLPFQAEDGGAQGSDPAKTADSEKKASDNPFSCDDPTAG